MPGGKYGMAGITYCNCPVSYCAHTQESFTPGMFMILVAP
jgi:hypothetical protein